MNVVFWQNHQNTPYDRAKALVKESHEKALRLIEAFSDEELFTKEYFDWTGTSSLSHYAWAIKKLKAHNKTYKP